MSQPAVGTALSVLLILYCCWVCSSRLLLAVPLPPAVGCTLLACGWLCSSRLLLALLFCSFVPLSEILVDLLLVVQVLRLCAPLWQSDFASFVDFFSPLALLVVVLFSVLCLLASPPPGTTLWFTAPKFASSTSNATYSAGSRWVLGPLSTVVHNNVVCCL